MAAAIANPSAGAILPVALLLVAAFTFIRSAAYGAVALTEDGVEIKNLLGKRIITLASICSVDPGYNGLAITTNDGKSYTALVIQKTNVSRWMGRRTRADEIADAIRRAADLSVATGHSHAQAHQQPDRDLNDRDD